MKPSDFVHLHCHSTYSLLEALPSPEEIVLRAKELGQSAVGIADKGFTYGLVELYQHAKEHGVKPILGIEAYQAARTRHDRESGTDTKSYPLILLCETQEGYENLLKLATLSAMEGMYYKPRVDDELLTKYGKGLIALSGPVTSALGQAALNEDSSRIRAITEKLWGFFGRENVYYELMDLPNVPGQAEVNQQLVRFSKELGVPCVVTCNSHYCRREDAEAHDILLCIQKNANVSDPSRFSMRGTDYSMRPFEELEQAFAHVPEALANTRTIADRCCVHLQFEQSYIPRFPVPSDETEEAYLTKLCEEGFARCYPSPTPELRARLEYELSVIRQVGFAGYFLIVADFVSEARRRGITVGPGRGSAAGSIASYCLGITGIDPIPHKLLFERFLNPERISLPDIDLDFADNRRDEILAYVREKYGANRVAQICTFGTLAARAAVKDVGRAYGIPFLEMNTLAKLIPDRPGTKLAEALQTTEMKAVYESNEIYRKIIDAALKLEGKARHVSVHACGVIITPEDSVHFTALQRAPKDENIIITQYGAKPLEALGLLKMDFLGLMNLTVIQTALEIIKRTRGKEIDIAKLPTSDKPAFQLLQRGDTTGVFQLESAGMRRWLRQLKPTAFEDITAMVALFRPGPMDLIPSFVKRKHGKEAITYLHPRLKPILESTYGIGVYQEQMMQIARDLAGYTLPEADILRKAIGKKIKRLLDEQKEKLVAGMVKNGIDASTAEEIWELFPPFARYGFNKSHAVGYALIAYQTAYLKANFPAEFMAALLSSDADQTDRVMIEIEECRTMGLKVLPPDINESLNHFTVVGLRTLRYDSGKAPDLGQRNANKKNLSPNPQVPSPNAIRFGLSAVKGVGESSVRQVMDEREKNGKFASIEDFAQRVPLKVLNKKLLESLAKSGALDCFGERRTLVEQYELIVNYRKQAGERDAAQAGLFGEESNAERAQSMIDFVPTPRATAMQKLLWEKETLGLYVSSHPLAGMKQYISRKARLIGELTAKDVNKKITIAGIQEGIKKIRTKKGETMAVIQLEDPTGKMEVTLFPKTFAEVATALEQPDTVLVVGGTVDLRMGQLQMRADAVKRASLTTMISRAKEEGIFDEEEAERGLRVSTIVDLETEAIDAVDEEGNVIAGETMTLQNEETGDEFLGPIGTWISEGLRVTSVSEALSFSPDTQSFTAPPGNPSINIHTIILPARAPKQLLLDLKQVFKRFPGSERVQFNINGQMMALPVTITMSPIVQQKIDDVLAQYAVQNVSS